MEINDEYLSDGYVEDINKKGGYYFFKE